MDNLKTLFDKKEYSFIIKLTENSIVPEDLMYRASSFIALNQPENAINTLEDNKEIMQKANLPWFMNAYIEVLCNLSKYEEAYEKIKYFENLPYYSQEAEETLQKLPKIVRDYERLQYSFSKNNKEISDYLISKEHDMVIEGINAINSENINQYGLLVNKILKTFPNQATRSLALLMLAERKINYNFEFNKRGTIISVNPINLEVPLKGEEFSNLANEINSIFKDPSLSKTFLNILTNYIVYSYPDKFEKNDEIMEAIYKISCSYLKIEYKKHFNVDDQLVDKYYKQIEESLK